MITSMMDQIKISKYSPENKDQDPTTLVPDKNKSPPLEGGNYTKIGGIWTLKHDIRSTNFYEIIINTDIKGYTALELKNFYNHIEMCLNPVTRLQ